MCSSDLPQTPFEASNALIERLPGWASGFAYSMFLMTGGRIGDSLFHDILGHVTERRLRRTQQAPDAPGDFLAYHFHAAADDGAWLNYLIREGLAYSGGSIPHEDDRIPVIEAQIEEVRRRQEAGLIALDLDPALLRLAGFALSTYPRILPQITRMVTGLTPDDPRFVAEWEEFLRRVGDRLRPVTASAHGPARDCAAQDGAAQDSAHGPARDGAAQDGAAQDGRAQRGAEGVTAQEPGSPG